MLLLRINEVPHSEAANCRLIFLTALSRRAIVEAREIRPTLRDLFFNNALEKKRKIVRIVFYLSEHRNADA